MRKTLRLPKTLVARVRAFRHAHLYDQESDAYAALLEKALEMFEQKERHHPPDRTLAAEAAAVLGMRIESDERRQPDR